MNRRYAVSPQTGSQTKILAPRSSALEAAGFVSDVATHNGDIVLELLTDPESVHPNLTGLADAHTCGIPPWVGP